MTEFLYSNSVVVIGGVVALALIALRAGTTDLAFRRDLRGALYFLIAFLALRVGSYFLDAHLPLSIAKALKVAWMLTFAFGIIRSAVSIILWAFRFRATPVPKILRDLLDFTLYAVTAVPILRAQLDIDLTGLIATSALLSVVIGLALQETLGNLFAGLALQLERPFQVGDFVTVGEFTGRVVQLAWRATRIETFRRELVTLPNNVVAKGAVKNYSRGDQPVGVDLVLGVSFDAPPNRVRDVVLDVLGEIPAVLKDPRPKVRLQCFEESTMKFQIRYFVADFAQSDNATDEIYSRVWYRFSRERIEIPFPHRVITTRAELPEGADVAERLRLISQVDLFAMMTPEEKQGIARDVVVRRFGRGERIITEGAEGRTFYIVAGGEVSVRAGKSEAEVARLRRGEYFGEMSLLTGDPRATTVAAIEDSDLYELERGSFARMLEAHPGLAKQLSALLAQRRRQLEAANQNAVQTADDMAPEAGRILSRLKQIFGLRGD